MRLLSVPVPQNTLLILILSVGKKQIKKIFKDSEMQEDSVIRKYRITAVDEKNYTANHYSLEMMVSVDFKVNSERAV